jgi:hypothetical protein
MAEDKRNHCTLAVLRAYTIQCVPCLAITSTCYMLLPITVSFLGAYIRERFLR